MPERNHTAPPAMVSGSPRDAGTMAAALYGHLALHAWRGPDSEQDAYQLFYVRSQALGWLDDRPTQTPGSAPALWGMNDAGWDHPRDADAGLISWFQVSVNAVAADQPLPVQPLLRCAHDATARAGTPHLSAVQVLLPVQGLDPASRPPNARIPAVSTASWFAGCDPNATTPVQISINSGQDPATPTVADQVVDQLIRLGRAGFTYRSHNVADHDTAATPPFDDSFWNGPPRHGVVLHGDIVEWSCDAIGWLAEVVADAAAHLGVRSPLLYTVTRTD